MNGYGNELEIDKVVAEIAWELNVIGREIGCELEDNKIMNNDTHTIRELISPNSCARPRINAC